MKNSIEADLEEELGGKVGEELEVDLDEDHEVDEDESSACAPFNAPG